MLSSRVITLFILFLISFSSPAQFGLKKYINEAELIVGAGVVSMRGGEWVEQNREVKIGYSLGVGLRHNFGNRFSLGGKFLLEKKGLKKEFDYYLNDGSSPVIIGQEQFIVNLNYITFPILFRYAFLKSEIFYVEGGGFVSYLLKQEEVSNDLTKGVHHAAHSESFSDFDVGITLGVGYNQGLNEKTKVCIQLSGYLGMKDVHVDFETKALTNSLSLTIGLIKKR